MNEYIERRLRRAWKIPDASAWYAGRAVIITRNDYAARLFNGDVGLCLADADGRLRVWFARRGRGWANPVCAASIHRPCPCTTAPSRSPSTRARGSPNTTRVAVLLPPDADHRILSRQLLYTGVSRAKLQGRTVGRPMPCSKPRFAQPVASHGRAGGEASAPGHRDWRCRWMSLMALHKPRTEKTGVPARANNSDSRSA